MITKHVITTVVNDDIYQAVRIASIKERLNVRGYILKVLCKELRLKQERPAQKKPVKTPKPKKEIEAVQEVNEPETAEA